MFDNPALLGGLVVLGTLWCWALCGTSGLCGGWKLCDPNGCMAGGSLSLWVVWFYESWKNSLLWSVLELCDGGGCGTACCVLLGGCVILGHCVVLGIEWCWTLHAAEGLGGACECVVLEVYTVIDSFVALRHFILLGLVEPWALQHLGIM